MANQQSLLLLLLTQFASLHVITSSYELPTKYFVNCGSATNVDDNRRTFIGDENRLSNGSFIFNKQQSRSATSAAANQSDADVSPAFYHTARVFTQQSSYAFRISDLNSSTSVYLLRLHFSDFDSDLAESVFDVAASTGDLLLSGFTPNNSRTARVLEFYVTLKRKTELFRIFFTPRGSSIAFVNAIEFFPSPPVEFGGENVIKVGRVELDSSPALQTVYRINVGGEKIDPAGDWIWREWDADGVFLKNKENAQNIPFSANKPNYSTRESEFAAPESVYRTAVEMRDNRSSYLYNVTWRFTVNESSAHFVRAHFCDLISTSLNVLRFGFYINGNFTQEIAPRGLAEPFYLDFAVDSTGFGLLDIGIRPYNDVNETDVMNAFLNGLEILEIKRGSASVPIENESSGNKSKLPILIGAVVGGLGLGILCILGVACFVVAKRKKAKPAEHSSWGHLAFGGSSHSRITEATISASPLPDLQLGLKITFSEIQLATKNFKPKLLIGQGGFGKVYKGTLMNGTKVAVKRSAPGSGQGLPEFHTEIMVLSSIRHRHLVSLIGYCDERDEMILVYEFMEKGTLRDHLYNTNLPRLTWKQRLEICIGSANGINYLHKGSSGRIIHRDVKSTNILLDENLVAKVADFGLSKSGPLDDTHVSTNVKGTLGYLDPEYFRLQQLTEKSDVYSFGVVLLEVLCARPVIDTTLPREEINLAEWAMSCKSKGVLEGIVDASIKDEINANSLRKFAETAEKCLQEDGTERPAMSDVLWDLEYALQLQQTPAPREPHEDSTATASGFSAVMVMPDVRRMRSMGTAAEEDDSGVVMSGDLSDMSMSEVFSQLKRDGAR